MDLSVVIINFNTPQLLEQCLQSLAENRKPGVSALKPLPFEVILVNTTPQDGSEEIVRRHFPWVKQLIVENKGFAANNNAALPHTSGRYLLFLNSDTTVPLGTLSALIDFMDATPQAAVVTPYVELASTGQFDPDTARRLPTPWLAFWQLFAKVGLVSYHQQVSFDKPSEIEATAGAAMLVRRQAAEQVGWWDERFFFYGEDLDWCYRFRQAGWKVMLYPKVKIVHHKGASSGIRKESAQVTKADLATRRKLTRASTEAMRFFYQKHYAPRYPWIFNQLIYFSIWVLTRVRLAKVRRPRP